ncbi:MAG TPA: FAD-dependent oxidoreductase [Solirubrobacteraceae bacterium]|jgi:ferredoxin--NADP+ reductase|nr:FAD-dependent oxidoreductase [Solirubrobacteraceae bacterium]
MTPIRIAVIGSGPAGFYTAGHLLKDGPETLEVDMIERLPTPWGLVRSGVAPDHPKIKSVTRIYEKTAAHPRFRFFGNVELGRDVSRDELTEHYHCIVYATGSPADRPLGIPGENLEGSHPATDFVGWYNGHPDYCDHDFDLSAERAVVIGNGNVALDVARMLTLTHDELAVTDIADHALEVLDASNVREIVVVGRRGPAQAAFTNPELLELGELADADVIVDTEELERALATSDPNMDPTSVRNVSVLRDYAQRAPTGKSKRVILRFLLSPTELIGDGNGVRRVVMARNALQAGKDGRLRAEPTGETEDIDAGLVMRAIGYRGIALPGVPFDGRSATIPNEGGRVVAADGALAGTPAGGPDGTDGRPSGAPASESDGVLPGEYAVGWIKRGPSGVIGTNKKDAQQTVDALLEDLDADRHLDPAEPSPEAIERLLAERVPALVTYEGWSEIDRHEQSLGEPHGRPRVKLTRIDELLRVAAGESPEAEPLDTLGLH